MGGLEVERWRRFIDAVRDVMAGGAEEQFRPVFEEVFDHEVEWQESSQLIDRGTYTGYEGFMSLLADNDAVWDELTFVLDEMFDAGGDEVVSIGRFVGRIRGIESTVRAVHVATFRGGRIVKVVEYEDAGQAGQLPAHRDP